MATIGLVLVYVLQFFLLLLLLRMVLSWVPVVMPRFSPRGVVLVLFELVYSLTDPPIRLVRRFLPSGPSFGGVRFDLGFMLVFFAVVLLQRVVVTIFNV